MRKIVICEDVEIERNLLNTVLLWNCCFLTPT